MSPNRCVVTGAYDLDMAVKLPENDYHEVLDDVTECAHIVPYSITPGGEVDKHRVRFSYLVLYK